MILGSTPTFQLSYTLKHTQLFLDQVHRNIISGFTPNSNVPDPNWGFCLQCAAIDRARLKVVEVVPRSALCSQCFEQYCYNPSKPPSQSILPNRSFMFVDPDPQGIDAVTGFFDENKFKFIGALAGLVAFLVALIVGL